jgi:hypothetical protein
MSVAPETGRNRIMIYGPKPDGTYVVEFETADGDSLAIRCLCFVLDEAIKSSIDIAH